VAPFGGIVTATVSATMVAAYRLWLGGPGTVADLRGIAVASTSGVLFSLFMRCSECLPSTFQFLLTGCASSGFLFSTLTLPEETACTVLGISGPPLLAVHVGGVPAIGTLLSRELGQSTLVGRLQERDALPGQARFRGGRLVDPRPPGPPRGSSSKQGSGKQGSGGFVSWEEAMAYPRVFRDCTDGNAGR